MARQIKSLAQKVAGARIQAPSAPAFGYVHTPIGVMGANGFLSRTTPPDLFRINSADFKTVSGKVPKLRFKLFAFTNATDPNVDLVFDVRPVTSAGGADATAWSIGSAVAGSGATLVNSLLNASDQEENVGMTIALPANGFYTVLVVPSGTIANNATLHTMVRVEYRWE